MNKKLNTQDFQKLIRESILKEMKSNPIKENFDDDDYNLGSYSGNFDPNEFDGAAMRAAMADIQDDGDEFVPLGKSKFEKNLDPNEFKADLQRQNLNLNSDKAEREKLQKSIDAKKKHEKIFGVGTLNEKDETTEYNFNTQSLGAFLNDAMYTFMEGEGAHLDYAEVAKILTEEIEKAFRVSSKISENETPEEIKTNRPKDSNGNDIKPRKMVKHVTSGNEGRVLGFGSENGKLTVKVQWLGSDFGGTIPKEFVSPEEIIMRDAVEPINEDEIEESMSRSHANGKGENLKPENFPVEFVREGLVENLDNATSVSDDEVFLVVDNNFNRAHYKELIGKTFDDAPGYAQVKLVNKNEVPGEANNSEVPEDSIEVAEQLPAPLTNEDFINKGIKIENLNEVRNAVFPSERRAQSIINSLNEEIELMNVKNNEIIASDEMGTNWIFDVTKTDEKNVYVKFRS